MTTLSKAITLTEFLNGLNSKTRAILIDQIRQYGTASVATFRRGNSKILIMERGKDITVEIHTLMNVDINNKLKPEQITNFLGVL